MNNSAAIGYAIMAAERLGLTREQIRRLESIMYRLMDEVTEEEAEREYQRI